METIDIKTAIERLNKARQSIILGRSGKGLCFYLEEVKVLDYLKSIGIWNMDTFNIEKLWTYNHNLTIWGIAKGSVEHKSNPFYKEGSDSFNGRYSSKEIFNIPRESVPEEFRKNFYWWDPSDKESRLKAIDLLIKTLVDYGKG